MGYGRYGVHFRDEVTLGPFLPSNGVNKTLPQGSIHNIGDIGANQFGGSETLPTPTAYDPAGVNLKPEYWAQTHHPSAGFTAYLLTGHEFFLELSQFVAGTCFLRQNNVDRDYGNGYQRGYKETTRGAAWGLRSIFQAATISVDGSAPKTSFAAIATNNIADYKAKYITSPCGSFGATRPYSNFNGSSGVAQYRVNAWEVDFSVCAWGYGLKMKPVSGSTLTDMGTFFAWHAQFPVHRMGALADSATYGFNAAGRQNSVCIAPSFTDAPWGTGNPGPWYANPGEVFLDTIGTSNSANTTNTIGAVDSNNGFFPDATSYWANLQTALAYAVEHGVAGAWEGYLLMVGASNWSSFDTSAVTSPVGALRSTLSPFGWVAPLALNSWNQLAGTNYKTWAVTNGGVPADNYYGTNPIGAIITAYSDPANDLAGNKQYFYGGGHGDGRANHVAEFNWSSLQWRLEFAPTPSAKRPPDYVSSGATTYPSGYNGRGYFRPAPPLAGIDAVYGTPLARISTHIYASAVMNTRTRVIHYFYALYGEYNTVTHSWSDDIHDMNTLGNPANIRQQLQAFDVQLSATAQGVLQTNLTTGASAVYDEVTDRFFVTLNAGDYANDNFHGFFVFNPYTRLVESVHNGGRPAGDWYWRVSTLPIRVGRKIYTFVEQNAGYLQPIIMNRGAIFDMDTKAFTFFVLDGGTTADDNTMPGFTSGTSTAETIPGCFDGTSIHRWNYNEASKRSTLLSMAVTPSSGAGTVGSPYVMPQIKRTLTGTPPAATAYTYTRMMWLPAARSIVLVPNDDSLAVAIRPT
jgi:hypothetical protein